SADHTTLVAAVKAAGLVETLSGAGPFTVFAPTNAAFDALPDGTVDTLLELGMKDDLTRVLTCHVVAADAMSEMISGMIADDGGMHEVETVGGCVLKARASGDMITLEDERGRTATVTIADVKQSNGVIHVVDSVLLPAEKAAGAVAMETPAEAEQMATADTPDTMATAETPDAMAQDGTADADGNPIVGGAPMFANKTIVENAVNSADHTTLVAAVKAAELVETLSGPGPFTVFAPVNAAFDALPAGTVETLLKPENKDMLTKILTAHVVSGKMSADDLKAKARAGKDGFYHFAAVSGDSLSAKVTGSGGLFIFDEKGNAYEVTTADVNQSNGVIHVVEGVLLPR
ncbi:hypothetical protein LCGC14_2766110, partial [marine sediment metagenome]